MNEVTPIDSTKFWSPSQGDTFKQFYTVINPSKPEVRKSLEHIVKNDDFNYSFVSVKDNPINNTGL